MADDRRVTSSNCAVDTGERARLGVLLVHGIGVQRPGDTLLTVADTLQSWLNRWCKQDGVTVSVDEASLVASRTDRFPARARLVFHDKRGKPVSSWLIAESYWADAFHPPAMTELARWCLRILLWAPVMYPFPWFQRAWTLFRGLSDALEKRQVSVWMRTLVQRDPDLAPFATDANLQDGKFLSRIMSGQLATVLGLSAKLAIVAVIGPVIALGFAALVVLAAIVPADFLKTAARSVQRIFSEIIGDSYFFVASPVTRAAVSSRIQHDVEWISAECDEVVLLAHSQGAAVAYDALRRLIDRGWESSTTSLISYGSGLRRLVSLERAFANPRIWNISASACQALVIIEWAAVVWMISGQLSILAALTIVIAAIIVNAAQLGAASDALSETVAVLPIPWKNIYASHDPVSAAGTEVKSEVPHLELALQLAGRDDQTLAGRFYRDQRVVTNQQSLVFDHTSYWRAADDFVASVAATLMRTASMPLSRDDYNRLDITSIRRRWRSSFLARVRNVALAAAAIPLVSPEVRARAAAWAARDSFPLALGGVLPDWLGRTAILGPGLLLAGIGVLYVLAASGWYAWDARETTTFFSRKPYGADWRYPKRLIVGWTALVGVAVALVWRAHGLLEWQSPALWLSAYAIGATVASIRNSFKGEGTAESLLSQMRDRGMSAPAETDVEVAGV